MNGAGALIRHHRAGCFFLFPPCEDATRGHGLEPGRGLSPEPANFDTLISDFQPPER